MRNSSLERRVESLEARVKPGREGPEVVVYMWCPGERDPVYDGGPIQIRHLTPEKMEEATRKGSQRQ